ncbi:MAG: 60S ribosomal export protein NMD3 [Euryarchaeota archaeon]|nr:60S ribosomal export protein NMD3 [Euryarchaeota archaeon]
MSHELVCPLCGKTTKKLYEGLCKDCYVKENELFTVDQVIDVTICKDCGAYMLGNTWVHDRKELPDIIEIQTIRRIKVHPEVKSYGVYLRISEEDRWNYLVEVTVSGQVYDFTFSQSKYTKVRVHLGVCDMCARRYSGYYEAIIQLRGPETAIIQALEEIRRVFEEDKKEFILKEVPVRGGIDVYVSSYKLARRVIKRLHEQYGGEIKETSTLYTRKEGRDIFRYTFLYRVSEYSKGAVLLDNNNNVYIIKSIYGKSVSLVDPVKNVERKLFVEDLKKYYRRVDISPKEAQILYFVSEDEVSVLDPDTYKESIIRLLEPIKKGSQKVKVVKVNDVLYHYPF